MLLVQIEGKFSRKFVLWPALSSFTSLYQMHSKKLVFKGECKSVMARFLSLPLILNWLLLHSVNVLDNIGTNFDGFCSEFMIKYSRIDFSFAFCTAKWKNESSVSFFFPSGIPSSHVVALPRLKFMRLNKLCAQKVYWDK